MATTLPLVAAYSSSSPSSSSSEGEGEGEGAHRHGSSSTSSAAAGGRSQSAKRRRLAGAAATDGGKPTSKPTSKPAPRARLFTAVNGNWPTFISIQVARFDGFDEAMQQLLAKLQGLCPDIAKAIEVHKSLHISLSRTVVLRMHQVEGFMAKLRARLQAARPFRVEMGELKAYYNEDRTRGFISWLCERGRVEVGGIIDCVDACLRDYGLPVYYRERSIHASLLGWVTRGGAARDVATDQHAIAGLWQQRASVTAFTQQHVLHTLTAKASTGHGDAHAHAHAGQPAEAEAIPSAMVQQLNAAFERAGEDEDMEAQFDVQAVSCRIGDKAYHIPLQPR